MVQETILVDEAEARACIELICPLSIMVYSEHAPVPLVWNEA